MKCPICGKDVELRKKQIGTNENGDPVFNEYAICRDCKKQWNLDKQRAKKMAAKQAAAKAGAAPKSADKPVQKSADKPVQKPAQKPADKPAQKPAQKPDSAGKAERKEKPEKPEERAQKKAVKKDPASKKQTSSEEEKRYGNIPSQKQRTKSETAVRKGYEEMLSTDPGHKPAKKKKKNVEDSDRKSPKSSSKSSSGTVHKKQKEDVKPVSREPEPEENEEDIYEDAPRFRAMRIILAVISLAGFIFFAYRGFSAGLSSVSAGEDSSAGMVYIVLALCMLVSAILYLLMQKRNTIFAFLLPMIVYLGSASYAFLMRNDDMELLISAIASAVLALISLILAITSRGGYDDYDDDDYDDPFEDDYADE